MLSKKFDFKINIKYGCIIYIYNLLNMEVVKAFTENELHTEIVIKGTLESPLFRASDVGEVLEMGNIRTTIQQFDDTEKVVHSMDTLGGVQNITFLTEKGLYKVLFKSRKPIAEKFQNWICDVIKEIRLSGSYVLQQQLEQTKNEKQQIEEKNTQLEEENKLLQKRDNVPMIYIYNIDTRSPKPELKIGYTINLHSRIKPYKQVCKHGKVELSIEIFNQNVKTVENFIHHVLAKYQIKDEVFRLDVEEAKMMVLRIVNTIKLFNVSNDGERQLKLTQLFESELEVIDNQPKEKVSTCEMSTQTDEIYEKNPTTTRINSDEKTQLFEQFITEHCIVRDDVEVSTTDIIGQYRIIAQSASKEVYHAFKTYLDTRFKPSRLKQQNQKNVINGYVGVTLREIEYKKSVIPSDVQNFVYHACIFSPSGKTLFSDLVEEYKKWKTMVQKPESGNESDELKSYLKITNYVLYTTIWANNGGGQGYYGITLKRDTDSSRTTSSTGKKVEKRMVDTNELLGTWDTIAKAAEAEKICAAKMSRSIKNHVVFQGDYYFCIFS